METQLPSPEKATEPPIFDGFYCGQMHQYATWYGGRPQPRRLCVRWGPSYPQEKGHTHPTQFLANVYCRQNGWIDVDATWYGRRPLPWPHCIKRGSQLSVKGAQQPASFQHMSIVATVAHLSYC